ncbi:MAG: nuclear transport factor 2 family protein [Sphingopyxis sp.]|nr:nuclear transport factor 2 family protein [Sphingopyxis sp.]
MMRNLFLIAAGLLPANATGNRINPAFPTCNAPAPAKSGEPYRYEIVRVDVAGPIASVTLVEGPYLGMQFTEFFHLLRVDGRWSIVSKTFMHT